LASQAIPIPTDAKDGAPSALVAYPCEFGSAFVYERLSYSSLQTVALLNETNNASLGSPALLFSAGDTRGL
jgi:hypothetical protein